MDQNGYILYVSMKKHMIKILLRQIPRIWMSFLAFFVDFLMYFFMELFFLEQHNLTCRIIKKFPI